MRRFRYSLAHQAQRVLITGVNGFIGRHLAKALVAAGFDVLGCSLESSPKDLPSSVEYHGIDLTDCAVVDALLARSQLDAVIHLAALVHVRDHELSFADYARAKRSGRSPGCAGVASIV